MSKPQVTLVPFDDLPDCAVDCGPLHDANGACVPPNVPASDDESTYQACFCEHGSVAGFKTGTLGVCNNICEGGDAPGALVAIQNWFAGACGVEKVEPVDGGSESGSGSRPKPKEEGGQSWVEMHWRWLVMIIVLFVAIITIWVLAFWWRRRHLRRKEMRNRGLGKHPTRASWGPGAAPPDAATAAAAATASPGVFNSADSGSSVERSKFAARDNGVS